MNPIVQKLKMPLLVVVIVIIAFVGYTYFFGKKGEVNNTGNLTSDTGATGALVAQNEVIANEQDFINLLLKIEHITIDTKIFSDPVFLSLQDETLPILDEAQGRENPFAPLGSENSISNVVATTTPAKNKK